ncbi:ABC-type sugar transport system, periplasmic component [Hahella chejuensis KCTC 2396]|uniref:ABC-type sugar transport system, periplasmic component n=2 Tax=Hahella chejuensis TaxID=158327 RepID=Q2SNI1_HAHCH|nr:ABC-type sugar transport system, periplasmic component [Hahella chejuensis KCTC 2396]
MNLAIVMKCLRGFIVVWVIASSWLCHAGGPPVGRLSDTDYFLFISPSPVENIFWGKTGAFAKEVAKDLGVKLEVMYGDDQRFSVLKMGMEALQRPNPPKAIIVGYFFSITEKLLQEANARDVGVFLVNTSVPERDRVLVGQPRSEKFPNWLGHMYPDDEEVGYLVAAELLRQAQEKWPRRKSFDLLGISGSMDSTAALDRNAGLKRFLSEHTDKVILKQLVYANWFWDEVTARTPKMLERYPSVDLIWAASDLMALAARSVAPEPERLIGGVDWSNEGLQGVKDGRLSHSVGGHFVEAGWAVVLLYDYFNGVDFADYLGVNIRTHLALATSANVDKAIDVVTESHWTKEDFRRFSLSLRPENKGYHFHDFFTE